MNILWFQHIEGEDLGTLEPFFDDNDVQPIRVSLHYNGTVPEYPGAYDAIISMGGPMSVHDADRYEWIEDEIRLLRQAMEQGTPVLGICLGAQLVARAAGADVVASPQTEIGWGEVTLTDAGKQDPLFAGVDSPVDVLHWHGEMAQLPEGATLLAQTEGCPHQAFKLGDNVYGVQFHVETTTDMLKQWATSGADWLAKNNVDPKPILKDAAVRASRLAQLSNQLYRNWMVAIGHADQLEESVL